MLNIMLTIQHSMGAHIDDDLILQIAEGDRTALKTLYEGISGNIYGYALSILKNRDDAEDVLQETFLKIFTAAKGYTPQKKPTAWVFTIAKNIIRDKLRKRSETTEFSEALPQEPDYSAIESTEQRMIIKALFSILNDDEKQIVILHAAEGMKHREIARILDIPLATALSRYNRAVKKMEKYANQEALL